MTKKSPLIFIVDDDAAMLSFISTALERAEFQTKTFDNGRDALQAIQQRKGDIDLLLTDIVMPGMDGIELSKEAEKLYPDIKTMFISGFSINPTNSRTMINFKGNLMAKPFHLNDLIARVRDMLSE